MGPVLHILVGYKGLGAGPEYPFLDRGISLGVRISSGFGHEDGRIHKEGFSFGRLILSLYSTHVIERSLS
jgi:hypothetical protein